MGVRAFSCAYLLFAPFSLLVCERNPVLFIIFFPGEVWLYQQEMQICFSFLTLCWPSFPVFLARRVYVCSAVSAAYFFS